MKIKNHYLRLLNEDFIYLEDSGKGISLTNDAEDVIFQLNFAVDGIGKRRVFYKDSFGDIDEIVLRDGQFSHFLKGDENIINRINQMLRRD